jgi:hypothetical protein
MQEVVLKNEDGGDEGKEKKGNGQKEMKRE